MAIHIENMYIESFRGIHKLNLDNLNHINIIAGDNNSGKTSILESILFLRNPNNFTNILSVALLRERYIFSRALSSTYQNFINLFPKCTSEESDNSEISFKAKCKNKILKFNLSGEEKLIIMEKDELMKKLSLTKRAIVRNTIDSNNIELNAFFGELVCNNGKNNTTKIPIEINEYETISGRKVNKDKFLNIEYISPTDHITHFSFSNIISNDNYKKLCLEVLKLFDDEISDILILKDKITDRPVDYIKHNKYGNMSISSYGDGIKKVLTLANGIAKAKGGVLLLDEVETAIHSKYYDDIFNFISKASMHFDVQVFITTHNIEAIDGLLATENYDNQSKMDNINVLTFKKDEKELKTHSRILKGRQVYKDREAFNFEVRQ